MTQTKEERNYKELLEEYWTLKAKVDLIKKVPKYKVLDLKEAEERLQYFCLKKWLPADKAILIEDVIKIVKMYSGRNWSSQVEATAVSEYRSSLIRKLEEISHNEK